MWDLRAGIREFCEKKGIPGLSDVEWKGDPAVDATVLHISMSETEPDFNTLVHAQNQIFLTE